MFREVRVYEIKAVLRVRGEGMRSIERMSSVERKTVRRYVAAVVDTGLDRCGEEQLDDVLLAQVCEAVRPHRPDDGHGASWAALVARTSSRPATRANTGKHSQLAESSGSAVRRDERVQG